VARLDLGLVDEQELFVAQARAQRLLGLQRGARAALKPASARRTDRPGMRLALCIAACAARSKASGSAAVSGCVARPIDMST
jgi:hypothetical protein